MRQLFSLFSILIPAYSFASNVAWPELPHTCFVKDRPATEEDVKKGCAAFVIKAHNQLAGTPLNIKIPQYAIHVDEKTGKEAPVVVIQAEENAGIQAVGYAEVGSSAIGAALLRELHLLGTVKPK